MWFYFKTLIFVLLYTYILLCLLNCNMLWSATNDYGCGAIPNKFIIIINYIIIYISDSYDFLWVIRRLSLSEGRYAVTRNGDTCEWLYRLLYRGRVHTGIGASLVSVGGWTGDLTGCVVQWSSRREQFGELWYRLVSGWTDRSGFWQFNYASDLCLFSYPDVCFSLRVCVV